MRRRTQRLFQKYASKEEMELFVTYTEGLKEAHTEEDVAYYSKQLNQIVDTIEHKIEQEQYNEEIHIVQSETKIQDFHTLEEYINKQEKEELSSYFSHLQTAKTVEGIELYTKKIQEVMQRIKTKF